MQIYRKVKKYVVEEGWGTKPGPGNPECCLKTLVQDANVCALACVC